MHSSVPNNVAPPHAPPRSGRRWIVVGVVALVAGAATIAAVVTDRLRSARGGAGAAAAAPSGAGDRATSQSAGAVSSKVEAPPADVEQQVKTVVLEAERLDRTVFAREVEAQKYEEYFIRLWDDFRAAEDKLAVLESAAFETLSFGSPGATARHDWGVAVTAHDGPTRSLDHAAWRALLARMREGGYRATEIEFHQSSFEHDSGRPARSTVATLIHLVNERESTRQVVRTKLQVEWSDRAAPDGVFRPQTIEATELTVAERAGAPTFQPVALPGGAADGLPLDEPGAGSFSFFLLVYDLDGDGRPEVVVPGANLLLRNRGGWRFEREQILPGERWGTGDGLIADFTGDGLPDLLASRKGELFLIRGVRGGRFSTSPPDRAVELKFPITSIAVLTAGDVDADGDLDAWFGQYKPPYAGGSMPTPYYDANDGYPAALLVNDGTGRFTDGTEAAGLASKRRRRTWAASFVDLDGDRDQDLLVNSDFSGLDIYYNDGRGRFADVTDQVIDERHNFGMGHTFADFNGDALLDMYTIGMSSTTARRLTAMGAGREEFPEHQEKRPQMGYGNRMFLATPPSGSGPARFQQPPFRDDVARTGWSWGTSSPDFDNDGDPDIYVANGFKSGTTCRDYCTTYWRRDIYLGSSKEDPVMRNLFVQHGPTGEISWNGFEHNVLFMNEGGKRFLNVAHLMGVAFEFDSRNVVSDDLDGDGKMDLLVLERRIGGQGAYLHALHNDWPTPHNWVGVRLAEAGPGFSPIGADVRVRAAGGRVQVGRIVTGDSVHSQHPCSKHFGLGEARELESIEVTWPNGQTTRLERPAPNRWHDLRPTPATARGDAPPVVAPQAALR